MSEQKTVVNPMSMNTALYYYNIFMDNYSLPHNYKGKLYTHSVPSSFVYNTVKDGCLWLITLIIGVAGYSVYFDEDTQTSKVLSLDFLNRAGVKDPALQYNTTIVPWEGLISDGRSPLAPSDHIVDGVGLPYLNGEDLLPIYRADPIQAILPEIDPIDGYIIYDDNGVMQVKKYTLCTSEEFVIPINTSSENNNTSSENNIEDEIVAPKRGNKWVTTRDIEESTDGSNSEDNTENSEENEEDEENEDSKTRIEVEYYPIYGWGMGYKKDTNNSNYPEKDCSLPLECINNNSQLMCYIHNQNNIYCLKTKFAGKDIKKIGSNYGNTVGSTEYMSRLESTPFIEWCKYHLTDKNDRFYIPLYWMSKYWAPFISWRDGKKTNSLQMIMMASAIYTTGYLSEEDMQGKSLSAITSNFLKLSLSQSEKDQIRRIVVNTQRAISLLEFIKRI